MTLFQPDAGEQVIYTGNALFYKSKMMAYPGEITITPRRLVFEQWDTPGSTPLTRMLMKSQRARVLFEIPLGSITRVYWKKFGLGKKMHIVFGNEEKVLMPDDLDEVLDNLPKVEGEVTA